MYKVPENQYKGSGWALCAMTGGQVIKVVYLRDASPAFADVEGSDHDEFFARQVISTSEIAPIVRELQALGEISVGMCSGGEFIEL